MYKNLIYSSGISPLQHLLACWQVANISQDSRETAKHYLLYAFIPTPLLHPLNIGALLQGSITSSTILRLKPVVVRLGGVGRVALDNVLGGSCHEPLVSALIGVLSAACPSHLTDNGSARANTNYLVGTPSIAHATDFRPAATQYQATHVSILQSRSLTQCPIISALRSSLGRPGNP